VLNIQVLFNGQVLSLLIKMFTFLADMVKMKKKKIIEFVFVFLLKYKTYRICW